MKRLFYIPFAIVVLVGALAAGVQAQSPSSQRMTANIPFTFKVGKTSLPAGKYTISVLNPSSDRRILQIRSTNGRASAMVVTNGVIGDVTEKSKLVFERDGDRYVFAQAQMAGDSTSLAPVGPKTHRVSQPSIGNVAKKTTVVITAG